MFETHLRRVHDIERVDGPFYRPHELDSILAQLVNQIFLFADADTMLPSACRICQKRGSSSKETD